MGETPKILDFGISRIGDDNSSLTGTGDVVGNDVLSRALNRRLAAKIDARADQYALGVRSCMSAVTGVRPSTGSAVFTIMRNIVEGIFEPPSRARSEIPRDLEAVVVRAMSRVLPTASRASGIWAWLLVPFMSGAGAAAMEPPLHRAPEAEMPSRRPCLCPFPLARMFDLSPPRLHLPRMPVPAPTKVLPQDQPNPGRWRRRTRDLLQAWSPRLRQQRPRHGRSFVPVASLCWLPSWSRCSRWQLGSCGALWFTKPARSSSSATAGVEATPPPAQPVVPVVPTPAMPEPSPARAAPSPPTNQVGGFRRGTKAAPLRNKITARNGKPREVGAPSDRNQEELETRRRPRTKDGKW